MAHDDEVFLNHILDAVKKIETYVSNLDEGDFYRQSLVQDGVIRQLEIIGEATKQLSPNLRQKYAPIPWQDLARMRDKLIHAYFGVDLEKVWLTVQDDLPALREDVVKILSGGGSSI